MKLHWEIKRIYFFTSNGKRDNIRVMLSLTSMSKVKFVEWEWLKKQYRAYITAGFVNERGRKWMKDNARLNSLKLLTKESVNGFYSVQKTLTISNMTLFLINTNEYLALMTMQSRYSDRPDVYSCFGMQCSTHKAVLTFV